MPRQTQFQLPQLTPRQLIALTPNVVQERATSCRTVGRQYSIGSRIGFQRSRPRYPVWYNEMRVNAVCPQPGKATKKRYSYVRFYGPPGLDTPVWLWCSCEHYAYTYEWVNAQYGSSSVAAGYDGRGVRIINKPPTIRNQGQTPGMCKHLSIAMRDGLAQTRDLAGEQGEDASRRGAATVQMMGSRPQIVVPATMDIDSLSSTAQPTAPTEQGQPTAGVAPQQPQQPQQPQSSGFGSTGTGFNDEI